MRGIRGTEGVVVFFSSQKKDASHASLNNDQGRRVEGGLLLSFHWEYTKHHTACQAMFKLFSHNIHSSFVLLIYNFKEVTPLGFLPESPFYEVNGNAGVQYMHTVYIV